MTRRTIGLALLAVAVLAFILTSVTGSPTAAFEPFDPVPYYAYGLVTLPRTGQPGTLFGDEGVPAWLIPTLAGTGAVLIAGYVALRFRSHRS